MLTSIPGVFKSYDAAVVVADGYAIEEKKPWFVATKECDGFIYYKPLRDKDYNISIKNGWDVDGWER
jgi:hypothetical protein